MRLNNMHNASIPSHKERCRQRKVGGICSASASTGMSRLCTRNSARHSESSISLNKRWVGSVGKIGIFFNQKRRKKEETHRHPLCLRHNPYQETHEFI